MKNNEKAKKEKEWNEIREQRKKQEVLDALYIEYRAGYLMSLEEAEHYDNTPDIEKLLNKANKLGIPEEKQVETLKRAVNDGMWQVMKEQRRLDKMKR